MAALNLKGVKKITPMLCNVASNTSKATCDAITAPGSAACQAEQVLRDVIEHNPFAHVDGNLKLAGNANACITNAQIDPKLTSASIFLDGSAKGHADLSISYHNRIAPGVGLCTVDWSDVFGEDISTTLHNEKVDFSITPRPVENDGTLKLDFTAGGRTPPVDLSPSPIDAVFLKHPLLDANCTILLPAAAAYLTYDTVFNEKLKEISPYASGKGVPIALQPFGFSAAIAPLKVKMPAGNEFALKPNWGTEALAFR